MGLFKGNIFKKIGRTITGKNRLGQSLHKVLPFKRVRTTVKELFLGSKALLPIPQFKDSSLRKNAEEAAGMMGELGLATNNKDVNHITRLVVRLHDKLDDGKLNSSISEDDLSPKTRHYIRMVGMLWPIVAYIVYAVMTGDLSLQALLASVGGS